MRFRRRRICFFSLRYLAAGGDSSPLFKCECCEKRSFKVSNVAQRSRRVWSIFECTRYLMILLWNPMWVGYPITLIAAKVLRNRTCRLRREYRGKKEEKKTRCVFCSLTVFVREQSFFLHRVACQPMDLLVSSKFVLSQIDVLSFSNCPLILHTLFL